MMFWVKAPLINVNEEQARLVEWLKEPGEYVHQGEMLCILETMKSTFELDAPQEGFFNPISEVNSTVTVGQIIAVLTEEKDQPYEIPQDEVPAIVEEINSSQVKKQWTKKAEIIARRNGLRVEDIASKIGSSTIITEAIINAYIKKSKKREPARTKPINQKQGQIERILIIGGGNVAVLVLDILKRVPSQKAIGIVDDNPALIGTTVMECPVLGSLEKVAQLWREDKFDAAALAIGILPARADFFDKFTREGIPFTNIIDPTAIIGIGCEMGTGNMVMGFCRLGPEAAIGDNNFLSAYVNIEHHNTMGSHCTFGPNVFMSGGVNIGSHVRFGTGISIEPRITIGDHVTIASGTVLTTHVPDNTLVRTKTNYSL
ncbi:MAG: hypothetical protein K8R40_06295 [Anaerolineaceae bacterium]|nr:hypothetical protein [Anaerolineaceae bacterium]